MSRPNKYPEVGSVHTRLTVLGVSSKRMGHMVCECVCGTIKEVDAHALKTGNTQSCGCLRKEIMTKIGKNTRKHGLGASLIYGVWANMLLRCNDIKSGAYGNYGARGIQICKEWLDVAVFAKWAFDNGYRKGMWIDRIDNDGDYSPENCRFVTPQENMNNTRRNTFLNAFGERKTIAQWIRDARCRAKYNTVLVRIQKGWNVERAIQTPPYKG